MDSNPSHPTQHQWYQMTVMELAVLCWIIAILISADSDPKFDAVDIIAFAISAMVTLIAVVMGAPAPRWFHFKLRLVVLFLTLVALFAATGLTLSAI